MIDAILIPVAAGVIALAIVMGMLLVLDRIFRFIDGDW